MTSPTVDRFDTAPEEGIKAPCRVISTSSIALSGIQNIDGVSLSSGDRVLVAGQANQAHNGIYIARPTDWQRASDFNDNLDAESGVLVYVAEGSESNLYRATFTGSPNIGVAQVVFSAVFVSTGASPLTAATRPPELAANMLWIRIVGADEHVLNYYDGADDIPILTIDPVDNSVVITGSVSGVMPTIPAAVQGNVPEFDQAGNVVDSGKPGSLIPPAESAGGTVQAITATFSPAITALEDRLRVRVRASGANTEAAPTFSPNSLPVRPIVKHGGAALEPGNIAGADHELDLVYNLPNTRWELLNPAENDGGSSVDSVVAWVVFGADGTIVDSENVSSVASNGTGNYTVNLSVTMATTPFGVSGSAGRPGVLAELNMSPYAFTTTSVSISTNDNSSDLQNSDFTTVVIRGRVA